MKNESFSFLLVSSDRNFARRITENLGVSPTVISDIGRLLRETRDIVRDKLSDRTLIVVDESLEGFSQSHVMQVVSGLDYTGEILYISDNPVGEKFSLCSPPNGPRFIPRPTNPKSIRELIGEPLKAMEEGSGEKDAADSLLLGESEAVRNLRNQIRTYAHARLNILLAGESGSGKELAAEAIHRMSKRQGELVRVNAATLRGTLFQDSVFGHNKGAFTGASEEKMGFLELAHGGTLFLDEIQHIESTSAAELLRVIESKTFRPLGGTATKTVDTRLITAYSGEGVPGPKSFPLGIPLYMRMAQKVIEVPPLRKRTDDIPILAEAYLKKIGERRRISGKSLEKAARYSWPGNVRQLISVLEKAVAESGDSRLISINDNDFEEF